MSRRRYFKVVVLGTDEDGPWFGLLRPVEAARRERVRRQIQRVKRRAARRWTA